MWFSDSIFESGDVTLSSIKGGKFLNNLSDCQVVIKNFTAWCSLRENYVIKII